MPINGPRCERNLQDIVTKMNDTRHQNSKRRIKINHKHGNQNGIETKARKERG
jgi:hypothetical protein